MTNLSPIEIGTSPAGVEWVCYPRPTDGPDDFADRVARMTDRLARLTAKHAEVAERGLGAARAYRAGDRFQVLSWWRMRTARVVVVEGRELVAVVDVVCYPRTARERRFQQLFVVDVAVDLAKVRGSVTQWATRVYSTDSKKGVPAKYARYVRS